MTLYSPNMLKRKLKAGETALGYWLSLNSLAITEMAAGAGWDWLLLDAEHSLHNDESIEQHFLVTQDWGMGSAIAVVLIIAMAIIMIVTGSGKRGAMNGPQ